MPKLIQTPIVIRITILVAVIVGLLFLCKNGSCAFYPNLEIYFFDVIPKIIVIGLLYVIAKIVVHFIREFLERRTEENRDSTKMAGIIRVVIWSVFLISAFSILFGDIGAILTSLGLIGFGITFALQKPILNFVGWVSIRLNKTFTIGDRIQVRDYTGDVVEINFMATSLKTIIGGRDQWSGKITTIPNELVLVEPVQNFTKINNFIKAELRISLPLNEEWKKSKKLLEEIATETLKKNIHRLRANLNKRISILESTIEKLSERFEKAESKERSEKIKDHLNKLEKEKQTIVQTASVLPDQYTPKVDVEIIDDKVILTLVFDAPFDAVARTKSEISMAFLDASRREKNQKYLNEYSEIQNQV